MLEPSVCRRSGDPTAFIPAFLLFFFFSFTWVLDFGFHSVSLLCHPPIAALPPLLVSK